MASSDSAQKDAVPHNLGEMCRFSAFDVIHRCHRCLALIYVHTVSVTFHMELSLCSQRLQHLCLPLLEAARSPLHLHAGARPGGERLRAFGMFQLLVSTIDGRFYILKLTVCALNRNITHLIWTNTLSCVCRWEKNKCVGIFKKGTFFTFTSLFILVLFLSFHFKVAIMSNAPSRPVSQ